MDALSRAGIRTCSRSLSLLVFATLALMRGLAQAEEQLPPGFTAVKPEPGRYQIVLSTLMRPVHVSSGHVDGARLANRR
jgi:hypothetical protein